MRTAARRRYFPPGIESFAELYAPALLACAIARSLRWVNRVDFAVPAVGPLTPPKRRCCLAIDLVVLCMIQALKGEH